MVARTALGDDVETGPGVVGWIGDEDGEDEDDAPDLESIDCLTFRVVNAAIREVRLSHVTCLPFSDAVLLFPASQYTHPVKMTAAEDTPRFLNAVAVKFNADHEAESVLLHRIQQNLPPSAKTQHAGE